MEIPQKFKTILNKEATEFEKVAESILKYSFQNRSLKLSLIVVCDFETISVDTNDQ